MPTTTDSRVPSSDEVRRRLDRLEDCKVNCDVYRVDKINFKEDLAETKAIALAANKKAGEPHKHCNKAEKVVEMERTLAGWGRLKLAVVISLFIVVATAVAGIVRTQSSVEAMDSTVQELKSEREKTERKARQEESRRQEILVEQQAIVTAAVKAAFKEAQEVQVDIQPDRGRRRDD